MSPRPAVLGQDLVDRLREWSGGGAGGGDGPVARAGLRRVLGGAARPVRRTVVRLVDPSLQATLDELRRQASAGRPDTDGANAEVEVLRAELLAMSQSLAELGRRLAAVERAIAEGRGPTHL